MEVDDGEVPALIFVPAALLRECQRMVTLEWLCDRRVRSISGKTVALGRPHDGGV